MALNGEQPDKYERLDECIWDLQDSPAGRYNIKSTPATREAAVAGIVGELEQGHLPFEELDMRSLAIFALSGASIKKGTPREARLAYRAVALLLLALRDGSPGALLNEAFPELSKAVRDSHDDSPTTLAAAIDCLAAASFAGARRAEEAQRSMEAIWCVIVPPARLRSTAKLRNRTPETSPVVLAAAVSAWTFLLTIAVSATDTQRNRAGLSAAIASLTEILDADDRRVRMAAGEALAVCVELSLTQHAKGKDGKGTGALAAKVSDLAAEPSSKHADNSLLREQKELFGQIAAFLDHGEPPVASWEWHGMMKVSTWVRLAQLNFLRRFLGNGFLEYVQGNPLLKEAFSFGRVEGKPLSIQKEVCTMPIDELLRDLNRKRDSWFYDHIICLPRTNRWPEELLQNGWH